MTAAAQEETQLASDAVVSLCPRCREPSTAFGALPVSGMLPKCPVHGLAFVEPRELAQSDGDSLLGATIASRFTVLGRLGKGSMGAVYRARQEAVGRRVALKIVRRDRAYDPETKARFERVARAISSLRSPHTITAFDFGESEDGSWYLAMEMLDGETVGERLRREGRIDWLDAARFATDALKSLAEAHAKGIIHRDLKPDNLFLVRLPEMGSRRELCKVLDFGIAKWQSGSDAPIDQLETQAGTVFGTPRYMSPEQAQGNPLDARSDLYSLGVLLYQMLSGRAPFTDDDAVVVMARHIKDEPPSFAEVAPDSNVPAAIEHAVRQALSKSPADRPQSAEDMGALLESAAELVRAQASGTQATQPALATPLPSSVVPAAPRARPWRALALGVASAALLAAVWFARRPEAAPLPSAPSAALEAPVQVSEPAPAELPPEAISGTEEAATPSVENSVTSSSSAAAPARPARLRVAKPSLSGSSGLARKGNERYGRFE